MVFLKVLFVISEVFFILNETANYKIFNNQTSLSNISVTT